MATVRMDLTTTEFPKTISTLVFHSVGDPRYYLTKELNQSTMCSSRGLHGRRLDWVWYSRSYPVKTALFQSNNFVSSAGVPNFNLAYYSSV